MAQEEYEEAGLRWTILMALAIAATLKEKEICHGTAILSLKERREIKVNLMEQVVAIGAMEEMAGLVAKAKHEHKIRTHLALRDTPHGYYSEDIGEGISVWLGTGAAVEEWEKDKRIVFLTESGIRALTNLIKEGFKENPEMTKRLASIFGIEKNEIGDRIFKEAEEEVKKEQSFTATIGKPPCFS